MNQKFQAEVNGQWEDMIWHDTTIDLSQYAGKKVTLHFITNNLDSASPWAVWSHPQIYQKNKSDKDFNVLIVSLDTLRADHLNCYKYKKRITSPNMNKLAEEGLLFKHFYSNAPGTLSSQISILTGLYPSYHGITYRNYWETMTDLSPARKITRRLIPKETLTTILANNGYYNVAYTGAGYFLACLDYSTGFHLYNNTVDHTNGSVKNVFPKAFKWLEQNRKRKFFLFLHTYEIHSPYTETYFVEKEGIPPNPKFERERALYDSCILLTDKYIGKLVSVLKKNNLWEKTILIITSDHGEELGSRYGVETHGHTLFNEIIHVPCIIILPEGFPQRKGIDTVASSVDLVPTILDILGIKSKIKFSGKSLLPIIHGNHDKNRFAYSEDINYGPDLKSLVMKHSGKKREELYKFLYINPSGRRHRNRYRFENVEKLQSPPPERFFNLERDPGETFNQTGISHVDYTLYQTIINDLIMNMPTSVPKPRKGIKASQNALKSLRAQGYIQ
jgi:arylsulfatase A-like enzyme